MNQESCGRGGRRFLWIVAIVLAFIVGYKWTQKSGGGFVHGASPEIGRIDISLPIFSSGDLMACFQQAEQAEKLKALILRIDSPGGFVGSSQELYARVRQFRERTGIPVIVSVENVCASGAYYIATAADTIIVNPGSQLGSIGVVIELLNVRDLMDKFGVSMRNIKTGELKDAGDPSKKLTAEEVALERKYFQGMVDEVLGQFVSAVAESRHLPEKKVREVATGGVFTGVRAVELGLADSIGNYVDAMKMAADIAGIESKTAVATVFEPPDERGLVERVLLGEASSWPVNILSRRYTLSFMP